MHCLATCPGCQHLKHMRGWLISLIEKFIRPMRVLPLSPITFRATSAGSLTSALWVSPYALRSDFTAFAATTRSLSITFSRDVCMCVCVCECVYVSVCVCFFCERRRGNLQKTPGNSSRAVSDSYRLKPLRLASPKALFPPRNCL